MIEETQRRLGPGLIVPLDSSGTRSSERERGGSPRSAIPSAARAAGGARGLIVARWRWISLVALIVLISAAALSWSHAPTYVSGADVLVPPQIVAKGTAPIQPDMGSELALATSSTVRDIAASRLHADPATLTGLSASVPLNTHVVHFAYSAGTPQDAAVLAQAFADAYVHYNRAQARGTGVRSPAATVITPATLPKAPSSPNHEVDLAVAVFVGLALGLAAAWLRDRFDDRPRSGSDLEQATGVPVLGIIPRLRTRGLGPAAQLEMHTFPPSRAAAAFHDLRRVIRRLVAQDDAKSLLVTGVRSEEQVLLAADLAQSLVQSYRRVVLVVFGEDRTLSRALQAEPARHALWAMPAPEASGTERLADTGVPGLLMLTLGPEQLDGGDTALRRVFRHLRVAADFVVVVGPDPSSAEIGAFGELVDLTVLVVDARRETRTRARAVLSRLDQFEHRVIGSVLTGFGRNGLSPGRHGPRHDEPVAAGRKLARHNAKED